MKESKEFENYLRAKYLLKVRPKRRAQTERYILKLYYMVMRLAFKDLPLHINVVDLPLRDGIRWRLQNGI